MVQSFIDKASDYINQGNVVKAQLSLLSSIAIDTQEMLEIARLNQKYIEQTMKEMGNGGTSNGPL